MTEFNPPVLETKKIVKAVIISFLIGILIFITTVLPAEYGADPTGLGKKMGFSKLHQEEILVNPVVKMEQVGSAPGIARPAGADNSPPANQPAEREDVVQIKVPAGQGIEYKLNMLKYGKVKYEWKTDQGTLFSDCHGEVKEGPHDYYESYVVAFSNNIAGTILAPYEGTHGWYFKNNSKSDIVVAVKLNGQYTLLN